MDDGNDDMMCDDGDNSCWPVHDNDFGLNANRKRVANDIGSVDDADDEWVESPNWISTKLLLSFIEQFLLNNVLSLFADFDCQTDKF